MNGNIIYDIHFLREENVSTFIKNYGKITDKELAKRLLCVTSNAWFILDDSLKKDNEIIMYYQPMAHIVYSIEADAGYREPIASATGYQKGFKKNKAACKEKYSYNLNYCRFPEIDYPENFDYELYADIQYDLLLNCKFHTIISSTWGILDNKVSSDIERLIRNVEYDLDEIDSVSNEDYTGYFDRDVERCDDEYYVVYDRSRLKEIVDTLSNKKNKQKEMQLKTIK